MPKAPKSVIAILGLAIAGIQAIGELIKVAKPEPKDEVGKLKERLAKAEKELREAQVELEPDAKKALYEDRWDMYN